jgi:hypothetical protein
LLEVKSFFCFLEASPTDSNSYYYGGLTEQQFDLSLELLLALDNPALEYEVIIA